MSNPASSSRKHGCTICKKRFKAAHHLREHITLHSDTLDYKCDKCGEEFRTPGSWRNHIRIRHGFDCRFCGKIFHTLRSLKEHNAMENPKISENLNSDGKNINFTKKLDKNDNNLPKIQEISKIINKRPTKFPISNNSKATNLIPQKPKSVVKKILEKSRLIESRNQKKLGTAKNKCEMCGLKFTLRTSLRRHMLAIHRDKNKYSCSICGHKANRSDNFKLHMLKHSKGISIDCTVSSCKMKFFSSKNLHVHYKNVHAGNQNVGIEKFLELNSVKTENEEVITGIMEFEGIDLLEELDQNAVNGEFGRNFDGGSEAVDETKQFFENSFLNSTEKSTNLKNTATKTMQTRSSTKSSQKPKKSGSQLKISTAFSMSSEKVDKISKERPKPSENSIRYECCECKIDFGDNNELWEHLLARHFHQMKNNVKK